MTPALMQGIMLQQTAGQQQTVGHADLDSFLSVRPSTVTTSATTYHVRYLDCLLNKFAHMLGFLVHLQFPLLF
jgi:hypothetical protein